MEIGELVSAPSLAQEYTEKCPFKEEMESGPAKADESIADDDKDAVQAAQDNDGGILGENLEKGKAGVADGGPYPATDFLYRQPANDTKHGRMTRLHLKEYKDAEAGDFPFTVAAHHLIPGNASLYKDDVGLFEFMKDQGKVKSVSGKQHTIKGHIGYDVNGSHNAVWLPGNYAIKTAKPSIGRQGTTPVEGRSWRALATDYEPWQFAYVAGSCKAADGQFHDTHENPYSASVRKNLAKITVALALHLDNCEECKKKNDPIPPPFRIKRRLMAISKRLRIYVTGSPSAWKRPWFTSERWSQKYFNGGKLTLEFHRAYAEAVETNPHVVRVQL